MLYCEINENKCISINNEYELHKMAVRYLKSTDLLFTCPLPIDLTTDAMRIQANLKGYSAGTPDLLILSPNDEYAGLALEFKTPTGEGIISKKQYQFIETLSVECNYLVVVSNDFAEIIEVITKYVNNIKM